MTISKVSLPSEAPDVLLPPSAQNPTASPMPRPAAGLGDLSARHAPMTRGAARLPSRAELPEGSTQDLGARFLDATRRATLGGQRDQRAIVDQILALPNAQVQPIINSQNENGDSALHLLAKSVNLQFRPLTQITDENLDLMRPLMLHGADPRLPNQEGKTPAHYVGPSTRVILMPPIVYEMAQTGPLNRERLERNRAAYAADPARAQALADAGGWQGTRSARSAACTRA